MMRWITILGAMVWMIGSPTAWAGFKEGVVAYDKGDYETAFREFRKVAEQGDARAQTELGRMYVNGHGVARDHAEAAKWFRKAAEQGDASAQYHLGRMYDYGNGVEQDYAEALKWYRKASEQGDALAQFGIWLMYRRAEPSVVRKVAEQGDADAQYHLGQVYFEGLGVAQDFALAHMWLNIAAASGGEEAKDARDEVAKGMTPSQIAEAQRLARECVARDYKGC